jgi:hypothetical protein
MIDHIQVKTHTTPATATVSPITRSLRKVAMCAGVAA